MFITSKFIVVKIMREILPSTQTTNIMKSKVYIHIEVHNNCGKFGRSLPHGSYTIYFILLFYGLCHHYIEELHWCMHE